MRLYNVFIFITAVLSSQLSVANSSLTGQLLGAFGGNTINSDPGSSNLIGTAVSIANSNKNVDNKYKAISDKCKIAGTDIQFANRMAERIVDSYYIRPSLLVKFGLESEDFREVFNTKFLQFWGTWEGPDSLSKSCTSKNDFIKHFKSEGKIDVIQGQFCFEIYNDNGASKGLAKPSYFMGDYQSDEGENSFMQGVIGGVMQTQGGNNSVGFYSNFYPYIQTVAEFLDPKDILPEDGIKLQNYLKIAQQCSPMVLDQIKQGLWSQYIFQDVLPTMGLDLQADGQSGTSNRYQ
ncbi:MAG: hypothetical protein JJV93_03045 [Alphaproteobacteria bacterium]|nr:hypothetical protein [Alphaproteobacteria bacterium]MBL0718204.1 hypothetical protein [Alphaproteobacteria bacterium]